MRTAVYSGTFDPPTLGHLDIIARAGKLFDRVVVGISSNSAKSPMFSRDERLAMLTREVAAFAGIIEVQACDGLIVDFCKAIGANIIVRGLRSGTDMDYEGQMAGMNHMLDEGLETVLLLAEPALQPIASSLVKDVARNGGDISRFVSAGVAGQVAAKLGASGCI